MVNPGVGNVERNIVASTLILKQEKNFQQQKIITMPFVVEKKKGLKKMSIAEVVVQDIVQHVGRFTQHL